MNKNSLYELILKEREAMQGLAINGILVCFSLKEVQALDGYDDPFVKQKIKQIREYIEKASRQNSFENWKTAYSSYSEICTYLSFKEKGINIERVSENKKEKTPDFQVKIRDEEKSTEQEGCINIEVKKLDWAQGGINLKSLQDKSYEIYKRADEERAKLRHSYICTEIEVIPLENKEKSPKATEEIDVIIKKISQNEKSEQLQWGNPQDAILVVDISLLYDYMDMRECLPAFTWRESKVSGRLWAIAFGKEGDDLFDHPEFEGAENIVKKQEFDGILQQFDYVGGLVFRVQGHDERAKFYGFYRDEKENPSTANILRQLCDYVNDRHNFLGCKLYKREN